MICIILVAGHGTILENDIKLHPEYQQLSGIPKALLPGVGGKRILDYWWEAIKARQLFNEVYLVTNADKYKHYERWATASDFPVENIVNDGTTLHANRLGAVTDYDLAIRTKNIQDDVMVVAGDMLFQDAKFDVAQVLDYFKLKKDGNLAIYYEMDSNENISTRGIVEVNSGNNSDDSFDSQSLSTTPQRLNRGIVELNPVDSRITRFFEKPLPSETESRLASVVFYCFRKETLSTAQEYLQQYTDPEIRNFGHYLQWMINDKNICTYGMKLPTGFQLIGQVGLQDYQCWLDIFSAQQNQECCKQPITKRAYARVGLMGNPSDGFYGKTIAMSITNFWAEVTIMESEHLVLVPHPLNDPTEFGSLADLHGISRKEGYLGGLRLLQATCKKFYQYCSERGIALAKRNFTLKYDTNIPRQVGLAGSSAIVTATLKCLMQFFNLTEHDMAKELQPKFILDVEIQELFITAGLQDRVIQTYEGLVYMDFSKELMDTRGYGQYVDMNVKDLPQFWLAYLGDPSDSGKIHSNVRERWNSGELEVIDAMKQFAVLTDQAKTAIERSDWEGLASLMNQNFDLRRQIYGDNALGSANLRMVQLAREQGAACKFPGSGGAIIGLCVDPEKMAAVRQALQTEGFVVCDIIPHFGGNNHNPPA